MKNKEDFESVCGVFIETVRNYFDELTQTPSDSGVPYLKDSSMLELKDFTGMIGISGSRKGFLYITGDKELYINLIQRFVGLNTQNEEDLLDMAGEFSNVVAGNLRETYGSNFMISVPIVFKGTPEQLKFSGKVKPFVIPIKWNNHEASMVIGLE